MKGDHMDTLHDRIVEKACRDDGWQTGDWRRAFLALCREHPAWQGEIEDDGDDGLFAGVTIRPDAWRLCKEGPETPRDDPWSYDVLVLEFLEVEITHPMSLDKRRAYVNLWWRFDASNCFHFRVYRAERYTAPHLWLDTATVYDEMAIVG
jgi:hypothetical protein